MRETGRNGFKSKFMRDLQKLYPYSYILLLDPNYVQGVPDVLILDGPNWATFEVKRSRSAKRQPNQDWHVEQMNEMSYSRFVSPETRKDILDELQRAFGVPWEPRISQR